MEFHKMQELPKQETDLLGHGEPFSVSVLVYNEGEPDYCEIGFYNFDTGLWSHYGDNSMKLICWCYLPDASEFIKQNELTHVLHTGYRK